MLAARWKGMALAPEAPPGGGIKSPEYLRMNPMGKMPTLEDDGRYLAESMIILEYLDDAQPAKSLLPGNAMDRAQSRLLDRSTSVVEALLHSWKCPIDPLLDFIASIIEAFLDVLEEPELSLSSILEYEGEEQSREEGEAGHGRDPEWGGFAFVVNVTSSKTPHPETSSRFLQRFSGFTLRAHCRPVHALSVIPHMTYINL